MFVLAAACEACSHTQSHSQTHKQTVLGGGATSMTTNQLKVLRPKSFACLRLSCDQTQSQIPTGPKKTTKTTHIALFPSPLFHSLSSVSLPCLPLGTSAGWQKFLGLSMCPLPCGSFTSGTPTICHLFLLNWSSCHAHPHPFLLFEKYKTAASEIIIEKLKDGKYWAHVSGKSCLPKIPTHCLSLSLSLYHSVNIAISLFSFLLTSRFAAGSVKCPSLFINEA